MRVVTDHPLIEDVLGAWRDAIGADHAAYRGHVYRTFNVCRALATAEGDTDDRVAVATSFHDIGLWPDGTLDYLPPSVERLRAYLEATGRADWTPELARMVEMHHKLTPYRGPHAPLVEALRRADLVDLTFGAVRFGLPRGFVAEVRRAFPTHGFHARILGLGVRWALRHPFRPLPVLRW